MSDTFTLTERRREALRFVQDSQVVYNRVSAQWLIAGVPVTGWMGRTLVDLLRRNLIKRIEVPGNMSTVVITEEGQSAMQVDTPGQPG